MATTKARKDKSLTREVLINELASFEKRLDNKFDIQTESLKGYIDSRISQVQTQMDRRFEQVDRRFEQVDRRFEQVDRRFDTLEKKLTTTTAGLAKLIETRVGEILSLQEQVGNHERRLKVVEARN